MASRGERVRFRRPEHLGGLEIVSARYDRRAFPPHMHQEYVIGAMTMGAEVLEIRGKPRVASSGDLILIEPGEPHANRGAGRGGFAYAVMYIPPDLVEQALLDLEAVKPRRFLEFQEPTVQNSPLLGKLIHTHGVLTQSLDALEQQSSFLVFLSELLREQRLFVPPASAPEHHKVSRARDFLEANFRGSVPLRQLAAVAGLSPFHLLRCFRKQVGLPPAAYQTQLRIAEAKRLLLRGCSIAEAAFELGFADQSHLTRQFQRIVGATPGRYAQQ